MEEFELIQRVRGGESDAFEEWVDIYAGDIERFAIQCGCTLKQAADVAEETFRNLHSQLESFGNEESLVCALYKNVLTSISHAQQVDPPNEALFPFEEDQELHEQIVKLETVNKVPFILTKFHKLDELEIATIMDTSPEDVQQAITAACDQLEGAQLEKRLEFLEKSYSRMKLSFRKGQIFAIPQKELQTIERTKQSLSKKVVISWVVGILVLLSLVTVPVVTGEEFKKASAEKYIERLKVSFEKEIGSGYAELGLTELPKEEEMEFNYLRYGEQARSDFELMIPRYEGVVAATGTLNKKKIEEEYERIIEKLELPSEKTARLFASPLTDDLEKSDEFMKGYLEQFYILHQSYSMILYKYEQIITDAMNKDGDIDVEKFMAKKKSYPEDLQRALDGMIKQNIYPTSILGRTLLAPIFRENEVGPKIRSSIHPDLGGFLTVMEAAPLVTYPGLVYTLEDSIDYLLEMEKTLLATTLSGEATNSLNWSYGDLFFEIAGGAEAETILGTDGKLKEEFRVGWERIASVGWDSPSALVMKQIIAEMEKTSWTKSQSRDRLETYVIQQALDHAKSGELDTYKMGGIIKSADGFEFVRLPDTYFENLVEETYYSFATDYDQSVLLGVSPLVIFGVYLYANEHDDPEVMWHLYHEKQNIKTLKEYINGWSKTAIDVSRFDNLQFYEGVVGVESISSQRANPTTTNVQMTLNEDQVWEITNFEIDSLANE